MQISFIINNQPVTFDVDPARNLLDVLRNELGLTGTKQGCDFEGECGACTVLLDGQPVRSCLTPVGKVADRRLLTIEGMGSPDDLHPLQAAFIGTGAVQCGYCTPGMLLPAKMLLDHEPNPTREQIIEALEGNLCRCTGYTRILAAVELAAARMRGEEVTLPPPTSRPIVGKDLTRIEAVEKVTGQTRYVEDISMPGLLYARVFRSPHPHACLLSLDTEKAQQLSGVIRIITAADIPGGNGISGYSRDEPLLVPIGGTVKMIGDPIALVVATSPESALAGVEAITAQYQLLPYAINTDEALQDYAPLIHDGGNVLSTYSLAYGDLEAAFAEPDVVIEANYRTTYLEHCALEREAVLAGHNLVHDIGYLEAGLATSPEMIVFTAEMISMMRRFMEGVSLDAEALALEVIHQVGPGGDFLTTEHTVKHFREMWQPSLFNRQRIVDWIAGGSKRLGQRLKERTISIIEGRRPEPLPDNVKGEIAYILTRSG